MITQELVKELFEYRDGVLFNKVYRSSNAQVGMRSGKVRPDGYAVVSIKEKLFYIHRLIFLYHHGHMPECVDHIDNSPLNNRIENLREATRSQNSTNMVMRKSNTSGFKNVYWDKKTKKWFVQIRVNKKSKSFGSYHDIEVANFIAETMRNKFHQQFARSK
jgi:hypothetical protein